MQALEEGHTASGMYLVKPENANRLMQVWCDQRHDPGGWTVIQRRVDGSVNFFRNWETYKVCKIHHHLKLLACVRCFHAFHSLAVIRPEVHDLSVTVLWTTGKKNQRILGNFVCVSIPNEKRKTKTSTCFQNYSSESTWLMCRPFRAKFIFGKPFSVF